MRIEQTTSANRFVSLRQMSPATPEAVLEELFNLLEEYGPAWYTEEHHNRAVEALIARHW